MLYYLTTFEEDNDLWVTDLRTKETKLLAKNAGSGLTLSKDGKFLVTISKGNLTKIEVESGKKEGTHLIPIESRYLFMKKKLFLFFYFYGVLYFVFFMIFYILVS